MVYKSEHEKHGKDTVLINFPLFCPKCRKETLIDLKQGNIAIVKEPDAQTQSR